MMRQYTRRFYSTLCLLALALCLGACSNTRYSHDFKSGSDFSQLKTFAWRSAEVNIAGISTQLLQRLIDEQLSAQGFTPNATHPDFLIDMQGFSRASQGGNTQLVIGMGMPLGRNGNIGLGSGQTLGKGKQEGLITLDITHTKTNSLLWRGSAEAIPLITFKLKAEHRLREILSRLLAEFPPQTTARQ
jgi:hypothetical protein